MGEPYLSKSMEVGNHVSDILTEAKLGVNCGGNIYIIY